MTQADDPTQDDPNAPKNPSDADAALAGLSGIPGLDFQNAIPEGQFEGFSAMPGIPDSGESGESGEASPPQPLADPLADPLAHSPASESSPPDAIAESMAPGESGAAAETSPPPAGPLDSAKALSENIQIAQAPVEAAYPFSLRIDGPLSAWEREKLIDLLTAENMGIREVDLEPQLEAGRILIPRISEYAGILLVQALRGTRAEISLGPSDQIFYTEETREDLSLPPTDGAGRKSYVTPEHRPNESHPAERIPVVMESEVPGHPIFEVVDLVSASTGLSLQAVEAEKSPDYQDALEALKRELRYKAHRKGATAIVNFTPKLEALRLASQYRLTVMGSAIRY